MVLFEDEAGVSLPFLDMFSIGGVEVLPLLVESFFGSDIVVVVVRPAPQNLVHILDPLGSNLLMPS